MLGARDPQLQRVPGAHARGGPEEVLADRPVRVAVCRVVVRGSAARTPSRWPRSGRSSRSGPSRASAGAPSGREPPTRAAARDRARRGTCSPRRAPDGSASAGSVSERPVASAEAARSPVADEHARRRRRARSACARFTCARLPQSGRTAMGRSAQLRAGRSYSSNRFERRPTSGRMPRRCPCSGEPLEQEVTLPDGRVVSVRVGVAEDSYIPRRELDTVVLELWDEAAESTSPASRPSSRRTTWTPRTRCCARSSTGLRDGSLEPTAGALEPLADSVLPE